MSALVKFTFVPIIGLVVLLSFCTVRINSVVSTPIPPWHSKYETHFPHSEPIIDVISNSSHIFALDQQFRLFVFTVASATGELGTLGNYDLSSLGSGICCNDWAVWRSDKAVALHYNRYDDSVYLATYSSTSSRMDVYRFKVPYTGVQGSTFYDWPVHRKSYFQNPYKNPRLSLYSDSQANYVVHYNNPPASAPNKGFFIANMKSTDMDHAYHASRTDEQALHVEFGCRQNENLVCIWTASKTIRVYQLSNTGSLLLKIDLVR